MVQRGLNREHSARSLRYQKKPGAVAIGNSCGGLGSATGEAASDVSSAAAEIYAALVMLSRTMHLSYVREELSTAHK